MAFNAHSIHSILDKRALCEIWLTTQHYGIDILHGVLEITSLLLLISHSHVMSRIGGCVKCAVRYIGARGCYNVALGIEGTSSTEELGHDRKYSVLTDLAGTTKNIKQSTYLTISGLGPSS
jgi:hypothetical protein